MRLPRRRDRADLLWQSQGPEPSRRSPVPALLLAGALGVLTALYPATTGRVLFAFLSGLLAGTALPSLVRRCPKCGALPAWGRFCKACGGPLDR